MTDDAPVILIVEDDAPTRTFLADNLCADGYDALVARTVSEGLALAEVRRPALAILDVGLPDGTGLDLLRRIRAADGLASRADPRLPVIVLSGHGTELDRLRSFEVGADDHVVKPFGYGELRARIAAVLRRSEDRRGRGRLKVGGLEIDPESRTVTLDGAVVELSQKEYALARTLATAPRKVFTKDELMRTIWGHAALGTSRTLDSHACRLRAKLGGTFVLNVWGVGYRMCDVEVAA